MATPTPALKNGNTRRSAVPVLPARLVGGALLFATGGIHLDLYLTGYRQIPTIGWMFLLQIVTAFAFGLAVLLLASASGLGRLVAASGSAFALATLGGYLLSMWVGLFGFKELRTTTGVVAAILEICAFAVLGLLAAAELSVPRRWMTLPLSAAAVVVLAASEITAGGVAASPPVHSGPTSSGAGKGAVLVVIKNFVFRPLSITATAGERIVVRNEDSVAHTLTASASSPAKFDSGVIAAGQSRTVLAPSKAGRYSFLCTIHQFMTGVLIVTGSARS